MVLAKIHKLKRPCKTSARTHLRYTASSRYATPSPWRRYSHRLAQVWPCGGAGVEKGVRPAPLESVSARFAAQVPNQKSHLRQRSGRPAPKAIDTCATNHNDTRKTLVRRNQAVIRRPGGGRVQGTSFGAKRRRGSGGLGPQRVKRKLRHSPLRKTFVRRNQAVIRRPGGGRVRQDL